MKKYILITVALLVSIDFLAAIPSQTHESVSLSSSVIGGFVNPAVLSYGHGTGLGYLQDYDANGFTEDFSLYLHTKALGYAYSQELGQDFHTLSFSFPLSHNLYFGSALRTNNFESDTSTWNFGALLRPANFISVGATASVPPAGDEQYTTGLALRPLAFGMPQAAHRISLFADLPWTTEKISLPKVGLHFEPVNGLQARFGYDLENEALGFSFSVALSTVNGGSSVSTDSTGSFESGTGYLQFAPQPFNYPEGFGNELYAQYDLGPAVFEAPQGMRTGPFYFVMEENSLLYILNELDKVADDPSIKGLVFVNQHPQMSLSTMRELQDALLHLKEQGKKIVFYSDYMNRVEYTLAASTADALYLHPRGTLDLRGLSASSPYFETFFEKYGIEVASFKTGPYKTAYNFLSESSMPEPEREALDFMLQGLFDEVAALIESGRGKKLNGSAADLIKNGPYLQAEDALSAGLVDDLIQQDELEEKVPFFSDKSVLKDEPPQEQIRRDWSTAPKTKVALIHAVGPIHPGEGNPGSSIGAENTAAAIRAARKDGRVKAILLRVNSGGGSALASDIIAREVELCRAGDNAKPVIVSMGGAAASGGYYISAFAEKIVASPFSLTGSIGVIAVFPNISDFLEKQHIEWDVVKQGSQADFGALYRRLSEAEQNKINDSIQGTYDSFLGTVSEGREMPRSEVEAVAGGRVWSGIQAKERGLVDSIGGYRKTLDIIAEELGTSKEIELVNYTYVDSWGTVLINTPDRAARLGDTQSPLAQVLPPEILRFYRYYRTSTQSGPEFGLMIMPYYVEGATTEKNSR
ncbi:MAG: signal peptide peptidase SppA [Spirochaetia bacterium]